MTGSAPQPGETPPPDSGPWATDGPEGAWWRGDPAAAAARFATLGPIEPIPPAPVVTLTPSSSEPETAGAPETASEPDTATEPATASKPETASDPEAASAPETDTATEPETAAELETDHRTRPTEELDTAAPARAAEPETARVEAAEAEAATESAGDPEADTAVMWPVLVREAGEARPNTRERVRIAWPERVPAPPPEPEERPFWLPVQEMPRGSRRPPVRKRSPRSPRRPATGLIALLVFALLATFFAWVSAEPLWLAVGHGDEGTAMVMECTGDGLSQRCLGEFTEASGAFTAERVRLLGVGDQDGTGTTMAARMVGSDSGRAYVDAASGVIHLRWGLGIGLVLLCGIGIVWATGSLRLENGRARRRATLAGLAGPLLVAIAFLAATF